jgi:uroporphyrinogen-III synthase
MTVPTDSPLAGVRVLVTRPAPQGRALCRLIETAGGAADCVPAIDIAPPRDADAARRLLEDRAGFDCAIFISRNAVEFAARLVPNLAALLAGRAVYAAGAGTRRELEERGLAGVVAPPRATGSEGLLQLDALRGAAVAGLRVLIVRGEGGREALRAELERRGATVRYAEVYARRRPPPGSFDDVWRRARPDIIVTTSNQGLENLVDMTDTDRRAELLGTPLVVMSSRNRERAEALGFRARIEVAEAAGDGALMQALEWVAEGIRER